MHWALEHLPFPMQALEGTWRTRGSVLYFLWKLRPEAAMGLTQSKKRTRGPHRTISWVSEAGPEGWIKPGRERSIPVKDKSKDRGQAVRMHIG